MSESSPSHILSEMKHSEVNASADILNDFCSSSYSEPADTSSERGLEQTSEPADTNCIERGSGLDQASLEEPKKLQDEVRFFENNFKNINFMRHLAQFFFISRVSLEIRKQPFWRKNHEFNCRCAFL